MRQGRNGHREVSFVAFERTITRRAATGRAPSSHAMLACSKPQARAGPCDTAKARLIVHPMGECSIKSFSAMQVWNRKQTTIDASSRKNVLFAYVFLRSGESPLERYSFLCSFESSSTCKFLLH